jgi:hypothetical protein
VHQKSVHKSSGFAHLLLLIPVLIVLVAGVFYYANNHKKQASVTRVQAEEIVEPTPTASLIPVPSSSVTKKERISTYKNDKYGYSFEYNSDYHVYVSPPDYIFVKKTKEEPKVLVEVGIKHDYELVFPSPDNYVSKIANLKNEPFESYVSKVLLVDCATLQLEEETYCNSIVSQEPYTNANGLSGYRVILHLVHAAKDRNGKRTIINESDWGPVYVLDVTDREMTDTRALIFKPQLAIDLDTIAADLEIKKIVDSVRF